MVSHEPEIHVLFPGSFVGPHSTVSSSELPSDAPTSSDMPLPSSIFIVGYGPGISNAGEQLWSLSFGRAGRRLSSATSVATLFAARGFSLGLISRNPKAPDIPGTTIVTASADGLKPDTVVAALTALKDQLGSPEVVVYNLAGLSLGTKPMMELEAATLEKHFVLGPIGGLQVAQWANDHLEGAKRTVSVACVLAKEQSGNQLFTGHIYRRGLEQDGLPGPGGPRSLESGAAQPRE